MKAIAVIIIFTLSITGALAYLYSPLGLAHARRYTAMAEIEINLARAAADSSKAALPAHALRDVLVSVGAGVGAFVIAVGGAFAIITWISKRASAVYPNSAGQYPVMVRHDWRGGGVIVHDPNRAIGPTTIYKPGALVIGQEADPQTQAQIATQAQAVGLVAAATRGGNTPPEITKAAIAAITTAPSAVARTPSIEHVNDPDTIAKFERLLEGEQ